ncbi:LysE family transporter [Pedobacter sp. MC2016-05]|jgi:threonine/homoserine/homoserine lactone efflux protein|uniref:LysE family translocator n=1 Tax=unclassified Pedobacter TaxID=2628915 RepID=UPI0007026C7A|nr:MULTISPECIES: LysE family transporter [unclassified Pedobacter]KQN36777.1 lysine transporter LysE [Pedobacter sp. Leaf41]MCX2476449.1 LysE family transporter [Pedobacter sp. MC2016-05]
MFEAILLGIGAGIISSFLTGPVFFAMIKTSIERGFMAGFSLAIGVIISDVILIALVLFGSQFFDYKASFDKYVGTIGGIFLLAVGIYYLVSKMKVNYDSATLQKISKRGYVLKGFLMCILTPSTLMFWIIVSGIISVKLNNMLNEKLVCFFIAMVTQLSIDGAKSFYSSKLRYKIKEDALKTLNKIAGVIIILFAFWLIYKTYVQFYA